MLDKQIISLDAVTITAGGGTQNGTGLDMGADVEEVNWELIGPLGGTVTSLDWKIEDSPDNSTWTACSKLMRVAAAVANVQAYMTIMSAQRYKRAVIVSVGASLTGAFSSGPVPGGEYTRY